ncbi:MAG: hypothetical protein ACI83B_000311 [Sediminicola sp.]|jgi:hypothetical protein|tara:strand:+ start:6008 stop:6193 length:186 start_codon:yes stop_codon:yes gene_type:complete
MPEVDNFCLQTDYFAPQTLMTGRFGGFIKFQGGEYEMATLSLNPLISANVLQLPHGDQEHQ